MVTILNELFFYEKSWEILELSRLSFKCKDDNWFSQINESIPDISAFECLKEQTI